MLEAINAEEPARVWFGLRYDANDAFLEKQAASLDLGADSTLSVGADSDCGVVTCNQSYTMEPFTLERSTGRLDLRSYIDS